MNGIPMVHQPLSPRARHGGYTLIELVIALGIGVAILLALMILFSSNSGNQQELERAVRQLENARFAVDTLSEDVMHAGYFSDFNPNRADPPAVYTSPDPCATATNAQGWAQPDPAIGTAIQVPRPAQGIPAATVVGCLADRRASTEALVIRRAEVGNPITLATASLAGRRDNLYIQTTRCRDEWGQVRLAAAPAAEPEKTFNLLQTDCVAGNVNNAVRRLLQRTYFVATCNDCAGGGDGVPTLKRVEMIDGQLRTTSVAEGVENLQFEFGVDTTGDGIPDTFLTSGAVPVADWQNVVSVRMHMLVRSTQPSPGHVETRTYQLGPNVSIAPAAMTDGFRRTLLSTTARLNNVGSRRE
jgi:type IV pilus assembly protein PilW